MCAQPIKPELPLSNRWLDRLGIGLSVACWVHCIVLPIIVVASPALSGLLFADSEFHVWLLALILPTAVLAFVLGWFRHRNIKILLLGGAGLGLITLASLQGIWAGHGVLNETMEKVLTSIGGLLLALGHFRNLRRTK